MAKPTFFHPDLSEQNSMVTLSPEESRHLMAARRIGPGDQVNLVDGSGVVVSAIVTTVDKRACTLELGERVVVPATKPKLTVCTAIPKVDRQRFMVEALVQMGVTKIIPIESQYSATGIGHKSLTKWSRYAIEAIKQSGNPWLPEISAGISFTHLLEQQPWDDQADCFLADPNGESITNSSLDGPEIVVLIGPEGGFSEAEVDAVYETGFHALRLGGYILRTEIAAIAATVTVRSR